MTTIMQTVAVLELTVFRSKKKSGTPMSVAALKQTSCRFVSPNIRERRPFAFKERFVFRRWWFDMTV